MQDYTAALEETGGKYTEEHAISVLRRIEEKLSFYRKAFFDNSQNAIQQYLFEYYVALGVEVVKRHFHLFMYVTNQQDCNFFGQQPRFDTRTTSIQMI